MQLFEILYLHSLLVFTLVLARLGTMIAVTPVFGGPDLPMQVRAFLAVALSLLVTPSQLSAAIEAPHNLIDYALLIINDSLVGLVLGLGLMLLLGGVQVAGQVISQLSGISLADVFNPSFDSEVPVFSHLLYLVTLAAFVIIGGHRKLLDALMSSFATLPPGRAPWADSLVHCIVTLTTESFVLGIRAAAPGIVALLLATLMLGLIGRALPQLNVLALGFGLNSLVTFGALSLSLAAITWLFQNQIDPMLEAVMSALKPMTDG